MPLKLLVPRKLAVLNRSDTSTHCGPSTLNLASLFCSKKQDEGALESAQAAFLPATSTKGRVTWLTPTEKDIHH